MEKITRRAIIIFILVLMALTGNAQLSDSIVGLNNNPSGSVYFCKMDIVTGNLTNYLLISNGFSSMQSAAVNYLTHEYYFCHGRVLTTIDAVSGDTVSNINLPITSTAQFRAIEFNPCDSAIYGILLDAPSCSFVKYDPLSVTMNIISNLGPGATPCYGCMTALDSDSGIYTFDGGNNIVGIDIYSGTIIYNSPKINLPNESFGHIALKCATHEFFGTSADVNAGVKYLSKIDPYTGVVTHVSNTGWNVGIYKPVNGGDCINQNTGDYFYSGAGGLLVQVNTITGNMISSQTVTPGEIYFIDHFSYCECKSPKTTGVTDLKNETDIKASFIGEGISIVANSNKVCQIMIYDVTSKLILNREFSSSIYIDTQLFNHGLYFYDIRSKSGSVLRGEFVK